MKPESKRIFKCVQAILILFFICPVNSVAEGTRQIMPDSDNKGQLCIDYSRDDFAFYDGDEDFRLNIAIKNTDESIRFGFSDVEGNPPSSKISMNIFANVGKKSKNMLILRNCKALIIRD